MTSLAGEADARSAARLQRALDAAALDVERARARLAQAEDRLRDCVVAEHEKLRTTDAELALRANVGRNKIREWLGKVPPSRTNEYRRVPLRRTDGTRVS